MSTKNFVLVSAVSGLLIMSGTGFSPTVEAATAETKANTNTKEKCYGVAKAGKNDCATKTSSCAGSAKVDGQKDAFIMVPKGLCDRLNGSSKA